MKLLQKPPKALHTLLLGFMFVTLFLSQTWLKLPSAPAPFTPNYVMGFVIILPLILALTLWGLTGLNGIKQLYHNRISLFWFLSLMAFAGWAVLSQHWAFVGDKQSGVSQNAALQIVLVFAFAVMVYCNPPPLRLVLALFLVVLTLQLVIGGLQITMQSSIGLKAFGEFTLDPQKSGVSVIQSDDLRWLRPYGLLPHPNIFAGLLIVGLFASGGFILANNRRDNIVGGVFFLVGLWIFLLTFSRGAWGSFGLGVLVALFFVLRFYGIRRRFISIGLLAIIMGGVFLLMYRPLMASRIGASEESIEMRSVADRIVFTEIALDAITQSPYIGIGAGNFPWYAAHYLYTRTDYDLRGDNVHQVVLGIWSEYGLVGLTLLGINLITATTGTLRNIWRYTQQRAERIAILGIQIAFLGIGLFDHYPWTLIHIQLIWFTMMALGLSVEGDTRN